MAKRRKHAVGKKSYRQRKAKPLVEVFKKKITETTKEQVDRAISIDSGESFLDTDDKRIREVLRRGRLVEDVRKSDAWQEVVQPLIDERICSVVGRKSNGRWQAGHFILSRQDQEQKMHTGYAMGLIEFNNTLEDMVKAKNTVEREEMKKRKSTKVSIDPMLETDDAEE